MILLVEAFVVGIIFLLLFKFFNIFMKNYNIEIKLILTGILGHLFFEFSGINKYYCIHGVACKK